MGWSEVRTLEAAVRDLYDDFRSASEAVRQAGVRRDSSAVKERHSMLTPLKFKIVAH